MPEAVLMFDDVAGTSPPERHEVGRARPATPRWADGYVLVKEGRPGTPGHVVLSPLDPDTGDLQELFSPWRFERAEFGAGEASHLYTLLLP